MYLCIYIEKPEVQPTTPTLTPTMYNKYSDVIHRHSGSGTGTGSGTGSGSGGPGLGW